MTNKNWIIALVIAFCSGCILVWFVKKTPDEVIKHDKIYINTAKEVTDQLKSQVSILTMQKTDIEKKLSKASELNKNINTHREYYPDGKLKSEDIIDLSKYVINTNGSETSSSVITTALMAQIDELKKQIEKMTYKEDKKEIIINYTGEVYTLWGELRWMPSVFGAGLTIINPIGIKAEYNVDFKHGYAGACWKF